MIQLLGGKNVNKQINPSGFLLSDGNRLKKWLL